jgi:hypothetical protein
MQHHSHGPPIRIEILTPISGVEFGPCFAEREIAVMDELQIPIISLSRLRENKSARGCPKDVADLDSLPKA